MINFKKICLEIKKQLFKIDPLQHHGLIFCPQKYLNFYEYFLLPTNVLIRSKSIINKTKLTVYECKNKEHPIEHLKNLNLLLKKAFKNGYLEHHKYQNKYLLDNFADINTMYQMKYFLSIIMTLPTYYLHSIGKPVYKKDSFEIAKQDFKKEWEIVDTATRIRYLWGIKEQHPYKSNKIPKWLIKNLGRNYFMRAYKLSNSMYKRHNLK